MTAEQLALAHYEADLAALAPGETTLEADMPVAWMTGVEAPPEDECEREAVLTEYRLKVGS